MDRLLTQLQTLWTELRRRKVVRVALVYGGTAFITLQVCDIVFPALHLPQWTLTMVVVLLVIGAPIALIAAWAFEVTPDGVVRTSAAPESSDREERLAGKPLTGNGVIVVLLVLILGLLAYPRFVDPEQAATSPTRAQAAVIAESLATKNATYAPQIDMTSVAVLPLTNLSGDSEQEYFSDGMTAELITRLARLEGLRVISRTSVMQYKQRAEMLRDIGEALGVEYIVEGSILQAGGRVRISAQLLRASTDEHLWADSFDRPMQDILTLQREVARAIAKEIEVQLEPENESEIQTTEVDPRAFELYLKGVQIASRRTFASTHMAIDYLEQSLSIDSTYAPTHARLAFYLALSRATSESHSQAQTHIHRALELDPSLALAYVAQGIVQQFLHSDFEEAEQSLRRAVALSPGNATAHHELAHCLLRQGKFEEAMASEQRALYYSPLSAQFQSGLGEIYYFKRQYAQAVAELKKSLVLEPNRASVYGWLSSVYLAQGKYEVALDVAQKGDGEGFRQSRGHVYVHLGWKEKALEEIENMKAQIHTGSDDAAWTYIQLAMILTALGEADQALTWLERGYEVGAVPIYLKVDPVWDPLREEPRFQALLQKMGLSENGSEQS